MIILLCGYKGSGKDTCAEYIHTKYEYKHFKISKYLKEMLRYAFKFDDEQLNGNSKDTIDPLWQITPRDAMKFIGTTVFQFSIQKLIPNIERDFWVSLMKKDICDCRALSDEPIVISDLRFIHELDYIRRAFPDEHIRVVKILRSSISLQTLVTDITEEEHTKMIFNNIIPNNGTVEYLHECLDKLMTRILEKKNDYMKLID
jgi:hypothetical protein